MGGEKCTGARTSKASLNFGDVELESAIAIGVEDHDEDEVDNAVADICDAGKEARCEVC